MNILNKSKNYIIISITVLVYTLILSLIYTLQRSNSQSCRLLSRILTYFQNCQLRASDDQHMTVENVNRLHRYFHKISNFHESRSKKGLLRHPSHL